MMAGRTKGGPRYYSTKRSAAEFLGDIMKLLAEYGCGSYMVEQKDGAPAAVAFELDGLAYKLRPNVEGIRRRLEEERIRNADARAVAWAQTRHLLELQLEAITSGAAKASDVLAGYVLTSSGRTVGEMVEERAEELLPGERLLLPRGSS